MKKISEKVLQDMEKAGKQVLNDEELSFIDGGDSCGSAMVEHCEVSMQRMVDDWCLVGYCCYAALCHPDDDKGNACWSDYHCIIAYHRN